MTEFLSANWHAVILGIIEGLTEFLPISSTGHLIIISQWIGFEDEQEAFKILIQLGAILAILTVFSHRIFRIIRGLLSSDATERGQSWHFFWAIVIAFLPAAFFGILFHEAIKALLFSPIVVAISLGLGGVIMIIVDRLPARTTAFVAEKIGWRKAFLIGMFQALAMIPGVSRSGATIVGAMLLGVERYAAAEFSFFLAMPTMLGAFTVDAIANADMLTGRFGVTVAIGFVCAFVSALIVVKPFLAVLRRYGLMPFGVYRILLSAILLMLIL